MSEPSWVVITGASSGIGAAFAKLMAEDHSVLAIARREAPLKALSQAQNNIKPCAADVSTPQGQAAIRAALGEARVKYLVHNAGVLTPIGPLLSQTPEAIRQSLAINVEAPIALTRQCQKQLSPGARILNISSGAAHSAYAGWGAYCMGKAALFMAYEILKQELAENDAYIGSLRPGVVDTPMQTLIREQTAESFPAVEAFRALKADGALTSASDVARFMRAVLETTSNDRFEAQEWDIRAHWDALMAAGAGR